MAKGKYKLRPKARDDLEDIWTYTYRTWGIRQARTYLETIQTTFIELSKNPEIGMTRDEIYKGLHVYPSGKHLIFYFITSAEIDIVRILHERMDSTLHIA